MTLLLSVLDVIVIQTLQQKINWKHKSLTCAVNRTAVANAHWDVEGIDDTKEDG